MCHSLILSWQNHGTAIGQTDSAATKYAMFTCTGVLTAIGFVVLSVLLLLVQSGGRKLQSIGTPYYGSPLAGLIAWLGSILGIGCGSNDDLTYRAAQQWVSKLPPEKQKEVFYYTTQVSGECCRRKVDAKLKLLFVVVLSPFSTSTITSWTISACQVHLRSCPSPTMEWLNWTRHHSRMATQCSTTSANATRC